MGPYALLVVMIALPHFKKRDDKGCFGKLMVWAVAVPFMVLCGIFLLGWGLLLLMSHFSGWNALVKAVSSHLGVAINLHGDLIIVHEIIDILKSLASGNSGGHFNPLINS